LPDCQSYEQLTGHQLAPFGSDPFYFCGEKKMDDNIFDEDDALYYILYEECEKERSCLFVEPVELGTVLFAKS